MASNVIGNNNMLHASNINDTTIYPPENNNIPVNDPKTDSINPINDIKKLEKHDDTNCDKHEMEMEQLICDSLSSFHQFLKCQSNEDHKCTAELLKEARGLIFLQVAKGQDDKNANVIGNGIIMSRLQSKNVWSGPCAISLKGNRTDNSKNAFSPIDYILILRDDKVFKMIAQNEKFKLGYDVSIGSILQRNNNNNLSNQELHNDSDIKSVYVYSTSQPSDNGFILEGTEMYVNENYNKEFYASLVDPTSILNGNIEFRNNAEYYALCNILDKCTQNDYPNVDELFNKPKIYGMFNKLIHKI